MSLVYSMKNRNNIEINTFYLISVCIIPENYSQISSNSIHFQISENLITPIMTN